MSEEKKGNMFLAILGTWMAVFAGSWAILWLATEVVEQAQSLIEALK